ncbi:hypothetical protein [Paucisalibacillus globulus]|uniref:hypothetical protein n=1 Tax=Paucisalibacillus globulus TaxID=351095 RepID=UPI001FE0753E|nr:hypothetical protein [Paucisalibacillus globulus]
MKEVQERLGQSDIQMTMKIYTHLQIPSKNKLYKDINSIRIYKCGQNSFQYIKKTLPTKVKKVLKLKVIISYS